MVKVHAVEVLLFQLSAEWEGGGPQGLVLQSPEFDLLEATCYELVAVVVEEVDVSGATLADLSGDYSGGIFGFDLEDYQEVFIGSILAEDCNTGAVLVEGNSCDILNRVLQYQSMRLGFSQGCIVGYHVDVFLYYYQGVCFVTVVKVDYWSLKAHEYFLL